MRIAIHHRVGSFSDRWIDYCEKKDISYKIVNAFDSDIIEKVKGCDVFMWHHHHAQYNDVLTAKRILFALEHAGVKVFPDFKTGWHFDDKVAQKYLLEAIDAPLVPSYVFYDKSDALEWARQTDYPKVFKLKGGAGSANVKLIKNFKESKVLINKAFGKGFAQYDRLGAFKERLRKVKENKAGLMEIPKGLGRLFITTEFDKQQPPEKGYVYFQDFMPNNDSDIRVIVINSKAFGIRRYVRDNDFRASGSGSLSYEPEDIDINCVALALSMNEKLNMQSAAFDFVFDATDKPKIVEVCYGFSVLPYDLCPGYWDKNLVWHESKINPQEWMVESVLTTLNNGNPLKDYHNES
jgi:glutathione synthase/RimK-type ligase-like ATP-grasp enzyme